MQAKVLKNVFISKGLFYIYADKHGVSDEIIRSFDAILARLDRMNQNIEDLKSWGETSAVSAAKRTLSLLQEELISFIESGLNTANEQKFRSTCIDIINHALKSTLVKYKGWKGFLHNLVEYFTLGTLHFIEKESEQVLSDIRGALTDWKPNRLQNKEPMQEEQAWKTEVFTSIKNDDTQAFLVYKKDPRFQENFQDFLNLALAYQRKEMVVSLMNDLPSSLGFRYTFRASLKLQAVLIPKDLFYIYAAETGRHLSDEEIHSFDKIFTILNVLHHQIIEKTSKDLPLPDSVKMASALLQHLQIKMIKLVHSELDIEEFKSACRLILNSFNRPAEAWEDVFHRLKLSVFGYNKLGSNRYALYTPKHIIRDTLEAIEDVQLKCNFEIIAT